MKLTERQAEIYQYIVGYVKEHLYAPSIREIGKEVGLRSSSSVFFQLKALEEAGLIKIADKEPRAITITGYTVVANETLIRLYDDYARRGGF